MPIPPVAALDGFKPHSQEDNDEYHTLEASMRKKLSLGVKSRADPATGGADWAETGLAPGEDDVLPIN